MSQPQDAIRKSTSRPPPLLIGIGVLVIALGFGLPRLFSGSADPTAQVEKPVLESVQTPERTGLGMTFARLLGGLIVVCGLCILITRWLAQKTPVSQGPMQVLATLAIDHRCALHLVKANERRLLIGTDLAGVKALIELPGKLTDMLPEPVAAAESVVGPMRVSVASPEPVLDILAQLRGAIDSRPPKS